MFTAVYRTPREDIPVFVRPDGTLDKGTAHIHQCVVGRQDILYLWTFMRCCIVRLHSRGGRLLINPAQFLSRLENTGEVPCDPLQHAAVREVTRVRLSADHDLALAAEFKPPAHLATTFAAFGTNVGTPPAPIVTVPASGVPSIFSPKPMFSRLLASPLPSSVTLNTAKP